MSIPITTDDVKKYLIISSEDYDANIDSIVAIMNSAIDDMIQTDKLDTVALANIIRMGKLLMISGMIIDVLPATALGKPNEKIEITTGKTTTIIDNKQNSKNKVYDAGFAFLSPYLKDEITTKGDLQILASKDGVAPEFIETERDLDGNILTQGNMEYY